MWTVTESSTPMSGPAGVDPSWAAPRAGTEVAAGADASNQVESGDRSSAWGRPGDPDTASRDAAWLPALTELPERPFQYQIELRVDEATGRVVARVIDRESGEVVRQVPPEYVLQLAMYIDAWLGRVLDARA